MGYATIVGAAQTPGRDRRQNKPRVVGGLPLPERRQRGGVALPPLPFNHRYQSRQEQQQKWSFLQLRGKTRQRLRITLALENTADGEGGSRGGGGGGGDYSASQLGSVCMSAPLSW